MRLGYVGAGNMARALARGIGEPVVAFSPSGTRARALAEELGGEAVGSPQEVAERVDAVMLCHKPQQLEAVAAQLAGYDGAVVSVLGGTTLDMLRAAYPQAQVTRLMTSTPVEIGQGIVLWAEGSAGPPGLRGLLERTGLVLDLPERLIDPAMAMGCNAPAFVAVLAEALVDAGVRRGLGADVASRLVVHAFGGSAALIAHRDHDTLAVRREVTSPGGSTARGLAALERNGVRAALDEAVGAVLGD